MDYDNVNLNKLKNIIELLEEEIKLMHLENMEDMIAYGWSLGVTVEETCKTFNWDEHIDFFNDRLNKDDYPLGHGLKNK